MAHIPGLYLKPESFSPSYGRKKMTDTLRLLSTYSCSPAEKLVNYDRFNLRDRFTHGIIFAIQ